MDISGVMSTASQASKMADDPITVAVQKKVMDVAAETSAELINSVVHDSSEVPSDKLPPHLGRNINETA